MKILFITNTNPFNPTFGAAQRSFVLLNALLSLGGQVDIAYVGPIEKQTTPMLRNVKVVFWNDGHEWQYTKTVKFLRKITLIGFPTSNELEKIIDSLVLKDNYDYIACRYIQIAGMAGLYKYRKKLLLDIDDLPFQSILSHLELDKNIPLWKKIFRKVLLSRIDKDTHKWINNTFACFLPNKTQAKEKKCYYLPNIPVICVKSSEFKENTNNILFIGIMSYQPNYNGVDYFIDNVWKHVIEENPSAKFLIAGKGLPLEFKQKWMRVPNVEILGFVEDLNEFYSQGNIVVCPIYQGAGSNIKVIEAMSIGKACVLSEYSTRGFEDIIRNGQNAYIVSSTAEYAEKIIKLLSNDILCNKICENAMKSTSSIYSQSFVNNLVSSIIKK